MKTLALTVILILEYGGRRG